jgi:hypothetical protein
MACKVHRRRSEVPIVRLRGPSLGETVMKFAFDCQQTIEIAHQCCWRATADEDGHLYEASPLRYDGLSSSIQRRAAMAAARLKYQPAMLICGFGHVAA